MRYKMVVCLLKKNIFYCSHEYGLCDSAFTALIESLDWPMVFVTEQYCRTANSRCRWGQKLPTHRRTWPQLSGEALCFRSSPWTLGSWRRRRCSPCRGSRPVKTSARRWTRLDLLVATLNWPRCPWSGSTQRLKGLQWWQLDPDSPTTSIWNLQKSFFWTVKIIKGTTYLDLEVPKICYLQRHL